MRLKLPKFVEISNPQINRLYNGLTLVAACYVVYEFFWLFKFASFMEIGQFVSSDIWVSDRLNPEEKTAIAEQWNVEPLCTDPETYNYESVNGPWSYTNNSCLFPCDESRVRDTCLLNVENYLNVEASEVFIPTQMKETTYHRDMDEQTSQYFMPMAEDLRIDFTHSLEVKESAIRAQMTTGPWDWGDIIGFSDQDVWTVVLDKNRNIYEKVPPTYSVQLTVPVLLELAGLTGMLDKPQPNAGRNKLDPPAYKEGPIGRITGRELTLKLNCYNRWARPADVDGLDSIDGLVCTVEVVPSSQPWETVERLEQITVEGSAVLRNRIYHGIRVKVVAGGSMAFLDMQAVMAWVIGAVVLLGIPKNLTLVFTTAMLGHTSKIYKRVIYERFNIGEQVAGLVTRMMTNGVAFLELEDMHSGVSFRRMNERLRAALRNEGDQLDELEMSQLVDFCFKAVTSPESFSADSGLVSVVTSCVKTTAKKANEYFGREKDVATKKVRRSRLSRTVQHEFITIDDYLACCASGDRVGFHDVVTLFDSNRKMSTLENIFMPKYIKSNVMDRIAAIRRDRADPTRKLRASLQEIQNEGHMKSEEAAEDDKDHVSLEDLLGSGKQVAEGKAHEALWHLTLEERKEVLNASHFKLTELQQQQLMLSKASTRQPHEEQMKATLDRLAEREEKVEQLIKSLTHMMGNMGSHLDTTISKLGRIAPRSSDQQRFESSAVVPDVGEAGRCAGVSAASDAENEAAFREALAEMQKLLQKRVQAEIELVEIRSQRRESEAARALTESFSSLMQRLGRLEQKEGLKEGKTIEENGVALAAAMPAAAPDDAMVHIHRKFMEFERAMGQRLVAMEKRLKHVGGDAKSIRQELPRVGEAVNIADGSGPLGPQVGSQVAVNLDTVSVTSPSFGTPGAFGDGGASKVTDGERVGGAMIDPPPQPPT